MVDPIHHMVDLINANHAAYDQGGFGATTTNAGGFGATTKNAGTALYPRKYRSGHLGYINRLLEKLSFRTGKRFSIRSS